MNSFSRQPQQTISPKQKRASLLTERVSGNLEAPIASICPMSNRIKQPTLKEVNRALSTLDPANFRDREHLEDTAYILAVLNRLTKRVSGSISTPIDNKLSGSTEACCPTHG